MILMSGRQSYGPDHRFERRRDLDYYTLELTFDGVMQRQTEGSAGFRPQANQTLYLVPPMTPYRLRGRESGGEIWMIFAPRKALQDCLCWPRGSFGLPELTVPQTPSGRYVLQALQDVHEFGTAPGWRDERLAANALERLLLMAGQLCREKGVIVDKRIRKALDLMYNRASGRLSVGTLARAVSLSPSRFAHLFRQEVGSGPMTCLERIRIEKAQALLLRTDLRIKAIAAQVGFEDAYYFSTRFRKTTGVSPAVWRRCPKPV